MQIKKIEIENYKSFFERQKIVLDSGFNLFIGKNNSGKSSALELLGAFSNTNNPHKSPQSLGEFGSRTSTTSNHSIEILTNSDELKRLIKDFYIPVDPQIHKKYDSDTINNLIAEEVKKGFTLTFDLHSDGTSLEANYNIGSSGKVSSSGIALAASVRQDTDLIKIGPYTNPVQSLIASATTLSNTIYRFSALRAPKTTQGMTSDSVLLPDASNLPFCLNHLQTNDAEGHKELCGLINRIFPEVKWIQSTPINQEFQLRCLPSPPSHRRSDLAIPLSQMGTGIGNVIAILYVMLTSRFPQVIAIDEPNSFLHPKALRELLQILEQHGKQHQYVLTGHSPDVLTAIEPSTISYFSLNDYSTVVKSYNKLEFHNLRSDLSDLGIRMTDLHAKDRVLWVEGQTEEIVFPALLRAFCPELSAGTNILRVTHASTFESKKMPIGEVAKTYERLSQTSFAPPMVAIVLDRESRKPNEIENITKEYNKLLQFLPFKMIENFVLHPDAISAVLNSNQISTTTGAVQDQLSKVTDGNPSEADGAKILKEVFANLSEARLEFRKTTHTPELFEWVIENDPGHLSDLKNFIQGLFAEYTAS